MDSPKQIPDRQPNKFGLFFSEKEWEEAFQYILKNPKILFFDKELRKTIAAGRSRIFQIDESWKGDRSNMVDVTIDYNRRHMFNYLESHVVRLLRPLSIIDPVYDNAAKLKVLSIGPRNENEVFHLIAHGFTPENIEAIDVVSNSPLVRVADMHDIPFPNDSFDVIVSGWTLPYSRHAKQAIQEKVRVLRSGGLLCLGLTRVPLDHPGHEGLIQHGSSIYLSSDQILSDIGDGVDHIAFRHDPIDKTKKGAILLIVRIRK